MDKHYNKTAEDLMRQHCYMTKGEGGDDDTIKTSMTNELGEGK